MFPALGQHAAALRQAQHVQNQRHFPVAHNRRSGVDADIFQMLTERFDHDFLSVVNVVDHQSELLPVGVQHHDIHRMPRSPVRGWGSRGCAAAVRGRRASF
jgi:hypothetical protein